MAGGRPKKINETYVKECYELAKMGLPIEAVCRILVIDPQTVYNNKELFESYKKGNSECGKRVRALLLEKAKTDTTANIYLDKVLNKTTEKSHDDNIELKRENLKLEKEKLEKGITTEPINIVISKASGK